MHHKTRRTDSRDQGRCDDAGEEERESARFVAEACAWGEDWQSVKICPTTSPEIHNLYITPPTTRILSLTSMMNYE